MELTECFEMSAHKIQTLEITQKKENNSLNICSASSVAMFRSAKEQNYLKPFNLNYKRNFSIPKVFCHSKFLCATQL
jgi:hypothetical protein